MKTAVLTCTLLLLSAETAFPAAAPTVTCGATLSGKKTYTLLADLDCITDPGSVAQPITVKDRAVFDLNNFIFSGPVILDGLRAKLINGTVDCRGDPDECVDLIGAGKHTVEDVTVLQGASVGIRVLSNENILTGNAVYGNGWDINIGVVGNNNILQQNKALFANDGFLVGGDSNQFIRNYATVNEQSYEIAGDNNVFVQNAAAGAPLGHEGFVIRGSGNRLTGNVATRQSLGIEVASPGSHTIEKNITFENGTDLVDQNENCASTIWRNNIFQTSNQPCIQ